MSVRKTGKKGGKKIEGVAFEHGKILAAEKGRSMKGQEMGGSKSYKDNRRTDDLAQLPVDSRSRGLAGKSC